MYVQGRKFLVVTVINSEKRAIPIECIARLFEVQDDENTTVIDYFCGEEQERIWVKESFESIMAGGYTVVL